MKRSLFMLLTFAVMTTYAQSPNIAIVNMGKPKLAEKTAFETAYKQHVAKFHKGDQGNNTYEILSGPYAGYYFFVGSTTLAGLDDERSDQAAHQKDLETYFFPRMEDTRGTEYYRYHDSLSFHGGIQAEKYVVNVRTLKPETSVSDYRRELGRSVRILSTLKGNFWDNLSFGVWENLWSGSAPVFVSIRNLKDGFKVLEPNYFGPAPADAPSFRDEYVKAYGYDAWDERVKILDGIQSREQYIMKRRADLSSQ